MLYITIFENKCCFLQQFFVPLHRTQFSHYYMIEVNNKLYKYSYVLNTFTVTTIKGRHIVDTDDEGCNYNKSIRYMDNKVLIDNSLQSILNKEKLYVRRVIDYILSKLRYGENTIALVGTEIATFEDMTEADVSRGITRLEELEIIKPCSELPIFNGARVKKNLYTVNHNYIFRGNIKNLISDFDKQHNNLIKNKNNYEN